jgi:hypothetical protein
VAYGNGYWNIHAAKTDAPTRTSLVFMGYFLIVGWLVDE